MRELAWEVAALVDGEADACGALGSRGILYLHRYPLVSQTELRVFAVKNRIGRR